MNSTMTEVQGMMAHFSSLYEMHLFEQAMLTKTCVCQALVCTC